MPKPSVKAIAKVSCDSPVESLPAEIIGEIIQYLDLSDFVQVHSVLPTFYHYWQSASGGYKDRTLAVLCARDDLHALRSFDDLRTDNTEKNLKASHFLQYYEMICCDGPFELFAHNLDDILQNRNDNKDTHTRCWSSCQKKKYEEVIERIAKALCYNAEPSEAAVCSPSFIKQPSRLAKSINDLAWWYASLSNCMVNHKRPLLGYPAITAWKAPALLSHLSKARLMHLYLTAVTVTSADRKARIQANPEHPVLSSIPLLGALYHFQYDAIGDAVKEAELLHYDQLFSIWRSKYGETKVPLFYHATFGAALRTRFESKHPPFLPAALHEPVEGLSIAESQYEDSIRSFVEDPEFKDYAENVATIFGIGEAWKEWDLHRLHTAHDHDGMYSDGKLWIHCSCRPGVRTL